MRTIIVVGIFYMAQIINYDMFKVLPIPWFLIVIAIAGDIIQTIKNIQQIK